MFLWEVSTIIVTIKIRYNPYHLENSIWFTKITTYMIIIAVEILILNAILNIFVIITIIIIL